MFHNFAFKLKILSLVFALILSRNGSLADFNLFLTTDGQYELKVNNETWLKNSPKIFLRANQRLYTNTDATLLLKNVYTPQGVDILGEYQGLGFDYELFDDINTHMANEIVSYRDLNMVIFTQRYLYGAKQTGSSNFDSVLSAFPSFVVQAPSNLPLGFLSYGGMMAGDLEKLIGKWNGASTKINDGIAGGPLVLFTSFGDTLIISQFNEFMSTSMSRNQKGDGYLNYGIMSGVGDIPVGYSAKFMVYYSNKGINKAMEEWGNILLKYYGKDLSYKQSDFTAKYLSYWTNNGAYYYWSTEIDKDYQDTILDIFNDAQEQIIPYRSIQYDSWWYGAQRGFRQGAFQWDGTRRTDKLPNSLTYLNNKLGIPVTAQNKFWDLTVYYAKQNGGTYNFVLDRTSKKSLPDDPTFWDDLLRNASTLWGLRTYEQDWMNQQTIDFGPLMTNVSLGRRWLTSMGDAAKRNQLTVQYSMSLSRHVMQSVEIDAVTQVRVSNDYAVNFEYDLDQWRVGITSIFASALGLAPFRDVSWTTSYQPGNPYGPNSQDLYVELNSLVSVLTTGPVAAGDRIGFTNRTLLMRACNSEGLLLKPDRPITAIDAQIYAQALGAQYGPVGEVWSTYSVIGGYTFGVLLVADMKSFFYIDRKNIGFDTAENSLVIRKDMNSFYDLSSDSRLYVDEKCTIEDFCLFYVSPKLRLNGRNVTIIGETTKWVPMTRQRIVSLTVDAVSVRLVLVGSLRETIQFSFWVDHTFVSVPCTPYSSTRVNLTLFAFDPLNIRCEN